MRNESPVDTLPTQINIGSGREFLPGFLNLDINEAWGPDIVWDLNHPFPFGRPFVSKRFGTFTIDPGTIGSILAIEVLEHIHNLTTAMTSCLGLLKIGGTMQIVVPYDLSLGAWQDPTHVRAFNEQSWAYFTDWFWYLGWTEARFAIDNLSFQLSEYGQELRKTSGKPLVELSRLPRAVSSIKVTLRKMALTDKDRDALQAHLRGHTGP